MKGTSTEILAPVGSKEMLLAAVRCGADAVYFGLGGLNARRATQALSPHELAEWCDYCHIHGVFAYGALNILLLDPELEMAAKTIVSAAKAGIDAIIVQDLGAAQLVQKICPQMPLHASTQMNINSVNGARFLFKEGFSRVVLPRELSKEEMETICREVPLETEAFVHGAHCMSVSGQCLMSSFIGGRSGNRGSCAQPCRLPFSREGVPQEYNLSLRDLSLVRHIPELVKAGITSLKIEGRMKRPEYVAAAVRACVAVRDGLSTKKPFEELEKVFSRSGFTDGFFRGNLDSSMFGTRQKKDVLAADPVFSPLKEAYRKETPRVPITMTYFQKANLPITLILNDGNGHQVKVTGPLPEKALTKPTDANRIQSALLKLGGTPYYAKADPTLSLDPGLMVPVSQINALRRRALEALDQLRATGYAKKAYAYTLPAPLPFQPPQKQTLRARFRDAKTIPWDIVEELSFLYLPIPLALSCKNELAPFKDRVILEPPRVQFGLEKRIIQDIQKAAEYGYSHLAIQNPGDLLAAKDASMTPHGTTALNLLNTLSLSKAASLGMVDTEVSFECDLPHADHLGETLPLGYVAYGHAPVMLTRNCPGHVHTSCKACGGKTHMMDRMGNRFFISCGPYQTASEVFNPQPIFLADQLNQLSRFSFLTLHFVEESAKQAALLIRQYQNGETREKPREFTRGLAHRPIL